MKSPYLLLLPLLSLAFAAPAAAHRGEVACTDDHGAPAHDDDGDDEDDDHDDASCKQARKASHKEAVQACNARFRASDCAPGDGVCKREAAHELGACKRAAKVAGSDCKVRDPKGKKPRKEKHGKRDRGDGVDRPTSPAGDDRPSAAPAPSDDGPAPTSGPTPSRPPPPSTPRTKLPPRI